MPFRFATNRSWGSRAPSYGHTISTASSATIPVAAAKNGYETELFHPNDLSEDLLCGICLDVLNSPTSVCLKGHTFCQGCIASYESTGGTACPHCRDAMSSEKHLNLIVQNIIRNSCVQCPNTRDDGKPCGWKGTLEDYLETHKDRECLMRLVECPLKCGAAVRSHDLTTHTDSECKNRMVVCKLCSEEVTAGSLAKHHDESCPEALVSCEYCDEEMKRSCLGKKPASATSCCEAVESTPLYSGHYRDCPKMPVVCRYFKFGCQHCFLREHSRKHHQDFQTRHVALLECNVQALWTVCPRIRLNISMEVPVLDKKDNTASFRLRGTNHTVDGHNVYPVLTLIDGIVHTAVNVSYSRYGAPHVYRAYFSLLNKKSKRQETRRACLVLPTQRLEPFRRRGSNGRRTAPIGGALYCFACDEPGHKSDQTDGDIPKRHVTMQDLVRWSASGDCQLAVSFEMDDCSQLSARNKAACLHSTVVHH